MESLDYLKNEVLKMKTAHEIERSKLEAKQAADLAKRETAVTAAEQAALKKLLATTRAKAAAMGCRPDSKIWSVHDCHTHCLGKDKGIWARGAVANGSYGVCIGVSTNSKDTANLKINGPLGEVSISRRRWNNAKDISIGDTLYMGDTVAGKVFQGKVVAQPINGPFATLNAKDESFLVSLNSQRTIEAREVEIVFKVEWKEVASLDGAWKRYLGTSRRVTVSQLTGQPPQ